MDKKLHRWEGSLVRHPLPPPAITMRGIVRALSDDPGFSKPFLARASDRNDYWIKGRFNPASAETLATELIISKCGKLIGAPTCTTELILIPAEFDGEKLDSGVRIASGIAHGSLNIESAVLTKECFPPHRGRDDNRLRHAGLYALHDWCFAKDLQWLHDVSNDLATYSHDHGLFLPPRPWSYDTLDSLVDKAFEMEPGVGQLDSSELRRISQRLDALEPQEILSIVAAVPLEWCVPCVELESIAWFLHSRAAGVAERLRASARL